MRRYIQNALKQLEAANISGPVVDQLRLKLAEEERRVHSIPEIKNRDEIKRLREQAIKLFTGAGAVDDKRLPLAEPDSFISEPYFVEGSPEFRDAILNRSLSEVQFALEPFRRNWLDDCIICPVANNYQLNRAVGSSVLTVRDPEQTAVILSNAQNLGEDLRIASDAVYKESVGHLIQKEPDSPEAKVYLKLIEDVETRGGSIATLLHLTPAELGDLHGHIDTFCESLREKGREMLLDLLRNKRIDEEVYNHNAHFIEGLLRRNKHKDADEEKRFWKATDLKLINICVQGHCDLKKISKFVRGEDILSGVNSAAPTDENLALVWNRLAIVLFMAEQFRARIEDTLGSVAGKLIRATLDHFEQIPELQDEIQSGDAENGTGKYIITTLRGMSSRYEKYKTLTPKQIDFVDDLVEGYKAILFDIAVKLRQSSTGREDMLMVHQRRIP